MSVRVFVPPGALAAGDLRITGDEHHYLARVRRARPGDVLELVDGAGSRAAAVIVAIDDAAAVVAAGAPERIAARPPRIRALVPPIKGDRMDACLEKLVEVGADEVVIWPAARAVVRLGGERRDARRAKYEATLQAAARQCGRAQVPAVAFATDLADAIGRAPGLGVVLDPASDGELGGLPLSTAPELSVVSGPEGGLAPEEREQLARAGFAGIGLGPRVLRAETAPVVAIAVIRALTRT